MFLIWILRCRSRLPRSQKADKHFTPPIWFSFLLSLFPKHSQSQSTHLTTHLLTTFSLRIFSSYHITFQTLRDLISVIKSWSDFSTVHRGGGVLFVRRSMGMRSSIREIVRFSKRSACVARKAASINACCAVFEAVRYSCHWRVWSGQCTVGSSFPSLLRAVRYRESLGFMSIAPMLARARLAGSMLDALYCLTALAKFPNNLLEIRWSTYYRDNPWSFLASNSYPRCRWWPIFDGSVWCCVERKKWAGSVKYINSK